MLEIFLIISISKSIANMMKEKGRSAAGYIVLFVLLWFGGEIMGAIVGVVATEGGGGGGGGDFPWMVYIFALIGAGVGGGIGYAIAASVSPLDDPDSDRRRKFDRFDDEDDYERDRRRKRDFDDDDRRDKDDGRYKE